MKVLYKKHEIHVADYLLSLKDKLRDDFLRGYNSLQEAAANKSVNTLDHTRFGVPISETEKWVKTVDTVNNIIKNNIEAWKVTGIKDGSHSYDERTDPDNQNGSWEMPDEHPHATEFATAFNLVKSFGSHCNVATYSIMKPNSVIVRHSDPDNKFGKNIRIHVPLIVPDGDVFLEVNGEETDYKDLFGFSNQFFHSAHNYTNEHRLIFIIDISREYLNLEPSITHKQIQQQPELIKPFLRNGKEWHLY